MIDLRQCTTRVNQTYNVIFDAMKRALAERVKQDMGDPVIPPSAPPSSMPGGYASTNGVGGEATGHPPSKMPRLDGPVAPSSSLPGAPVSSSSGVKRPRSPNATSSGNMTAFQSQTTGGGTTPRGRGRKSSTKQQDSSDEDDGDNSSFYLKQQNTSLASELYAYRRRIYLLEREREFRRRECRLAERKIGELSGVWKGLESALGKELERNELLKGVRGLLFSRCISLASHNSHHHFFAIISSPKGKSQQWVLISPSLHWVRNGCGNDQFPPPLSPKPRVESGENPQHRAAAAGSPASCG